MLRALRLRRARTRFLEACRNLSAGRESWTARGGVGTWLLAKLSPMPVLGLHEEGTGLLRALEWLEENSKAQPLGEAQILGYHRMVMTQGSEMAGTYRRAEVSMQGSSARLPKPREIPFRMKNLDRKLSSEQSRLDASSSAGSPDGLPLAVETHLELGLIHPFEDGNGRVARLAMNHILRRYGMGYVIYPPLHEAPELFQALEEGRQGNLGPLLGFARRFTFPV